MYVSIDTDELLLLHVHTEHDIVSGLATIEAPNRNITVDNTERNGFLCNMKGLQLRTLYRNVTGLDITGTPDNVVIEMLATLIETFTPRKANMDNITAQVDMIAENGAEGLPFAYNHGSNSPAKANQLYALHCAPLSADQAQQAAARAPQRCQQVAAPARPVRVSAAPSPGAAPKQRASSVRPVIWAVADEMWAAAGSPTDKAVVLELRKKMMTTLETDKGVKRTSSSNELGNWMKARLG